MRVLVYVRPGARDAERLRRALEREVRAQGHELLGSTHDTTTARAMRDRGIADRIAGKPEHLTDLAPWALALEGRVPRPRAAAAVVVAAAELLGWVRDHPVRAAVAPAATLAVAGLVALPLLLGPEPPRVAAPTPTPGPTNPVVAQPELVIAPGPELVGTPAAERGRVGPEPVAQPEPQPSPEPTPGPPEATTVPTPAPTEAPVPEPEQPDPAERCVVDLELLNVSIRVCLR